MICLCVGVLRLIGSMLRISLNLIYVRRKVV